MEFLRSAHTWNNVYGLALKTNATSSTWYQTQTEPTVRSKSISDNLETVSNSLKLHVDPRMLFIKSSVQISSALLQFIECSSNSSPKLLLDLQLADAWRL